MSHKTPGASLRKILIFSQVLQQWTHSFGLNITESPQFSLSTISRKAHLWNMDYFHLSFYNTFLVFLRNEGAEK